MKESFAKDNFWIVFLIACLSNLKFCLTSFVKRISYKTLLDSVFGKIWTSFVNVIGFYLTKISRMINTQFDPLLCISPLFTKGLGHLRYFLGIEISQFNDGLLIYWKKLYSGHFRINRDVQCFASWQTNGPKSQTFT